MELKAVTRIELTNPTNGAAGYVEVSGDTVTLLLPPFPAVTLSAIQAAAIADVVNIMRRPFVEPNP